MVKRSQFVASADKIQSHLEVLCRRIGTRIAASKNEVKAAEYIAGYMERLGLTNVTRHRFPFMEWGYETSELYVKEGRWRRIACVPVSNTPSTPAGGMEAELLCVNSAAAADLQARSVRNKIVLVWGTYGETTEKLDRLARSGAAAVVWVDTRLPFDWPVAVGTPYDWRDRLPVPQVSIPFTEAWRLARLGRAPARLHTKVWKRAGQSVNVFADLPGTGSEIIHIGAHMDTVILGRGADDDGSGIAVMLETARLLSGLRRRPRRTIRFVAYGAEEHLSEGARQYVLAHREAVQKTLLCINLDSVGSIAGHNEARVVGGRGLVETVKKLQGYACQVLSEVSPYSDMFAFNIFGAPSVWFYRVNMPGTRYFHHSVHDDLGVVSASVMAQTAAATAALAYRAAFAEPPWKRDIPEDQCAKISDYARRFYGL